MKIRWQNYVLECVVSFVGDVNVVFFLPFFNGIFVKYPCWWIAMTGDMSIYNILSHYQASIWNQSWLRSSTVALNYKMFAWGPRTRVLCNPSTTKEDTLWAISPKLFAIVSEMCSEGAPKPNFNPLLMCNTSVWHSWVSERPLKATLIFFICSLVKVKKEKGDERLHILTQPWQISYQSTYSILLFHQNPEEGLGENPDVLDKL